MLRPLARPPLAVQALLVVVLAGAGVQPTRGQDVLTVGSTGDAEAGTAVVLPVFVHDRPATALDAGGGAGATVQQLAVSVTVAPAAALAGTPTFQRAGVAAAVAVTPVEHHVSGAAGERSWLVAFFESGGALPLSTAAKAPGNLVGTLSLPLAPGLPEGTRLDVTLDPLRSALGNAAGAVTERPLAAGDGDLALVDGAVIVAGPLFADGFESGDAGAWSLAFPAP